jgi:hypothetical protein
MGKAESGEGMNRLQKPTASQQVVFSRRIRLSGDLTSGFLAVRSTAVQLGTKW